jgi:hypothetical protein
MLAPVRKIAPFVVIASALNAYSAAHAADLTSFPAGSVHENVVSIGKKQIPLPVGQWALKFSSALPEFSDPIPNEAEGISIFLVQREGKKYLRGVLITTNARPGNSNGWVRNRVVCDRKNVHFNRSDRNYNATDADCWQVNHLVNIYKLTRNPIYNRMKRWARRNAGSRSFLALQYVLNDAHDILRVSYIVNPTAFGFPAFDDKEWSASQWHRNFIGGDKESETAIQLLRETGEKLHTLVRKGFRNELGAYRSEIQLQLRP